VDFSPWFCFILPFWQPKTSTEKIFYASLYVAEGGEVNETAEKLLRFGRYVAKFRRQFLPLTSAFFRATYPLPEKAKKCENGKIRIVVC